MADRPDDIEAPGAAPDPGDPDEMQERLDALGERIAATRHRIEADDMLPGEDGSGGGGGDAFSDALGFSDRTDTEPSLPGDPAGDEPGDAAAPEETEP